MDEFVCDYGCRTVAESIAKYNIPGDWCAEFDVYEDACPVIAIQVDQLCRIPAIMELKLRIVEKPDDEYAGCMVLAEKKTIAFKVDYMSDLVKAIEEL